MPDDLLVGRVMTGDADRLVNVHANLQMCINQSTADKSPQPKTIMSACVGGHHNEWQRSEVKLRGGRARRTSG